MPLSVSMLENQDRRPDSLDALVVLTLRYSYELPMSKSIIVFKLRHVIREGKFHLLLVSTEPIDRGTEVNYFLNDRRLSFFYHDSFLFCRSRFFLFIDHDSVRLRFSII